jgi:TrmH family RNA methyltransferase
LKNVEKITSLQNPRVKAVRELQEKSRERRKQLLFVVEGLREISLALEAGYRFDTLFYWDDLPVARAFVQRTENTLPAIPVSKEVFEKMAYREHSDGLLAVVHAQSHSLEALETGENPLIIVVEAVEKPGNLGAILRTADAAKATALIVCDPLTDIYNPNIIRSSIGCLFTQQIAVADSPGVLHWLRQQHILAYAAELQAAQWYHETDFTQACALILGTEASGLSSFWLQHADARLKIPMRGKIDSLNVSVSAAILTFEAMRQRNFR